MANYINGKTIKDLREKQSITQKQMADILSISDKTVSKWETGRGLPDISMIEPIAKCLKVSIAELFSGDCVINSNRHGNMLRGRFYVCPICGNIIYSMGEGVYSCCGITLPPLEEEEKDENHQIKIEKVEDEYYVSVEHPMSKDHYISFVAYVTGDRQHLVKLYPEQNSEVRIPLRGHGKVYIYCNRHGLFQTRI